MTRWFRGPELEQPGRRDRFDPIVDGAHYRLPPALLLAIWDRACADATDRADRRDEEQARRRFHDLAARIAARGGKLRPDVGACTRVDAEGIPGRAATWPLDELRPRIPGRRTLVTVELLRRAPGEAAATDVNGEPAPRPIGAQPGEHDWLPAHLPSLAFATPWPVAARPAATLLRSQVAPIDDSTAEAPAVTDALERRGEGAPIPVTLREHIEALLQADLRRVRIHTDAVAAEAARVIRARAFTIGEDIFFSAGAFDPDSTAGRELLVHELTHVVQAQQGRVQSSTDRTRVARPDDPLEREAEQMTGRVAAAFAHVAARTHAGALDPTPQRRSSADPAVTPSPTRIILRAPRAPDAAAVATVIHIPAGGTPVNEIGVVAWDGTTSSAL